MLRPTALSQEFMRLAHLQTGRRGYARLLLATSFVTTKKTEALETARCQAAGASEENHDHFRGVLGSREEGCGPSFLASASPSHVAKRRKEYHSLAFAFICVNISKYAQGISNSSSSREERSVPGKGLSLLLFSDQEPCGYSAPHLF